MASSVTRLSVPLSNAATGVAKGTRRHITPEAGHALEKLGHAIEYLTDEMVHRGGSFSNHAADLEAVQMLMAANRSVYFDCPTVPTLVERLHAFLQRFGA